MVPFRPATSFGAVVEQNTSLVDVFLVCIALYTDFKQLILENKPEA